LRSENLFVAYKQVARYQADTPQKLVPLQAGVGMPAMEAAIFKMRGWARTVPLGHALLTVSVSNAVNTLDRSAGSMNSPSSLAPSLAAGRMVARVAG